MPVLVEFCGLNAKDFGFSPSRIGTIEKAVSEALKFPPLNVKAEEISFYFGYDPTIEADNIPLAVKTTFGTTLDMERFKLLCGHPPCNEVARRVAEAIKKAIDWRQISGITVFIQVIPVNEFFGGWVIQ